MDIYARDDDGDDTQDKAAASTQMMLDKFGATTLCVDLISAGIDSELVLECIKLLVALLKPQLLQARIHSAMLEVQIRLVLRQGMPSRGLEVAQETVQSNGANGYCPAGSFGSQSG